MEKRHVNTKNYIAVEEIKRLLGNAQTSPDIDIMTVGLKQVVKTEEEKFAYEEAVPDRKRRNPYQFYTRLLPCGDTVFISGNRNGNTYLEAIAILTEKILKL